MPLSSKADYAAALKVVSAALAAWDPYSLVSSGSPSDEFENEAAQIVAAISKIHSSDDVTAHVSRVFSSAFGPRGFSHQDCEDIGKELWIRLREANLL
jgi:hypothetical protein